MTARDLFDWRAQGLGFFLTIKLIKLLKWNLIT